MRLNMTKRLTKKKPGRPKISKDDHRPKKKRTRNITEEQREALRQRMVEMRKKRKPADYKNIHPTVLAKPEIDKLSMKNVKAWIKEAKDDAAAHAKNARGRGITPQIQQREMAMSESKKAYVRQMEHYLKTGDWIAQFMGPKEMNVQCGLVLQWHIMLMAHQSVRLVFGILTFVKNGHEKWKMAFLMRLFQSLMSILEIMKVH